VTNVYLKDDNGGTGKYIVWDFNGVYGGVNQVTFVLRFSIVGIFKNNGNVNTLNWSYQWGEQINSVYASVRLPVSGNVSGINWTPVSDGTYSNGKVLLQHKSIPGSYSYDISVSLPTNYGTNWSECKAKILTPLQKFLIAIASIGIFLVIVCLCVCCSVWSCLRSPWSLHYRRVGYYDSGGYYGHSGGSYQKGGYQNVGSVVGSSGFAG
jgi:hypothetical protein